MTDRPKFYDWDACTSYMEKLEAEVERLGGELNKQIDLNEGYVDAADDLQREVERLHVAHTTVVEHYNIACAENERLRRFEKQAWRLVEEVATLREALGAVINPKISAEDTDLIVCKAIAATEAPQ